MISASPAIADVNGCPEQKVCLWPDTAYKGAGYQAPSWPSVSSLKPAGFNDKASSLYNNTALTMRFYQDENGGGKYVIVGPYSGIADLRTVYLYNPNGTVFGYNTLDSRISSLYPQ
jgi:Peptidase inhibitor family I36